MAKTTAKGMSDREQKMRNPKQGLSGVTGKKPTLVIAIGMKKK